MYIDLHVSFFFICKTCLTVTVHSTQRLQLSSLYRHVAYRAGRTTRAHLQSQMYSSQLLQYFRDLPDGGITQKFTLDELLTNVMIYWTNGNIASSQRFYKELFMGTAPDWGKYVIHTPCERRSQLLLRF